MRCKLPVLNAESAPGCAPLPPAFPAHLAVCAPQFAALIAGKLGAKPEALRRALWGEYYFQAKEKKVTRKKPVAGKGQPMFVQFVLEPLWRAYGVLGSGREEAQATLAQMVKSLGLTSVTDKDLRHSDVKYALKVGSWQCWQGS